MKAAMARPHESEYAPFYHRYVSLVTEADVVPVLSSQFAETRAFLHSISAADEVTLHPPYTWTFRQVLGHLIDAERIFEYRVLRISRGDRTPLASFDEMAYAEVGDYNRLPLADLTAEFDAVRQSTLHLVSHLQPDSWARRGIASDNEITVRALVFIIAGHERHHVRILRSRMGLEKT